MQPAPGRPTTLTKPTTDTQYHIDYEWWERSDKDLVQTMISQLPAHLRDQLSSHPHETMVDYIDPATAEVTQVDQLTLAIRLAADDPDFVTPQPSMADAIFRIFVASDNQPMSSNQLSERLGRPPQTILKMLSGQVIYYGLRPVR